MPVDDFEPVRRLPITREQDVEIRAYIAHKLARDEPWDTLGFSCMLKDMLNLRLPDENDAERDAGNN